MAVSAMFPAVWSSGPESRTDSSTELFLGVEPAEDTEEERTRGDTPGEETDRGGDNTDRGAGQNGREEGGPGGSAGHIGGGWFWSTHIEECEGSLVRTMTTTTKSVNLITVMMDSTEDLASWLSHWLLPQYSKRFLCTGGL